MKNSTRDYMNFCTDIFKENYYMHVMQSEFMRYSIRLIMEIICRFHGHTATGSIRLLLLLPFTAMVSFGGINLMCKATLRNYRSYFNPIIVVHVKCYGRARHYGRE